MFNLIDGTRNLRRTYHPSSKKNICKAALGNCAVQGLMFICTYRHVFLNRVAIESDILTLQMYPLVN